MALTRSEIGGLAVAAIGHAVLFGLLSVGFLATPNAETLKPQPIAVSFAEDVALESAAPVISSEAEAAKKSPVEAPVEPETAPPQPVAEPEPEPVAKPQPAPPKPAPAPAAKPKPAPPAKPAPLSKSAPAKAAPARPAPAAPASNARRPVRPTGNLDGLDLGRTNNRNATATTPPAAMTGKAAADIGSAIVRQTQPCANRQVNPGPGADQIRVIVNLRLNRDGTLAGPITIRGHEGVDDTNQRYVTRVDDAVRAIFAGCSPLRGLPAELYDVPRGWKSFTFRYRLKS